MAIVDRSYNYDQVIDESIQFLLAGPSVIGWIIGIIHYPLKSREFLMGFQNGITSLIFLKLYALFYIFWLFFDFPGENTLSYIESFLSLVYLCISVTTYFYYRKNKKVPGSHFAQS